MMTYVLSVNGHVTYPRTLAQAFAWAKFGAQLGCRITLKKVRL